MLLLNALNHSLIKKPKLNAELLQELHRLDRHPHRLPMFMGLYSAAAGAAVELTQILNTPWCYVICLPFYLLAAASLHGISLFTHEGVHGTLSHNSNWNRILSILCALPVLQTYSAYRVLHLKHHQNLGTIGDPDHYKNYTSWNGLVFLMHWGRLLVGYPVYIMAIPILGFKQGDRVERLWIIGEVICLGLLMAVVWRSLPQSVLVHGWLIPMMLVNVMVNIRGMSQHTLLEQEADEVCGTRTILTNPVTRFFMCNENYHLEHHLYPGVPWYHLPRLHQALQIELRRKRAPYIHSYFSFVQDFIVASFSGKTAGTITIHS